MSNQVQRNPVPETVDDGYFRFIDSNGIGLFVNVCTVVAICAVVVMLIFLLWYRPKKKREHPENRLPDEGLSFLPTFTLAVCFLIITSSVFVYGLIFPYLNEEHDIKAYRESIQKNYDVTVMDVVFTPSSHDYDEIGFSKDYIEIDKDNAETWDITVFLEDRGLTACKVLNINETYSVSCDDRGRSQDLKGMMLKESSTND